MSHSRKFCDRRVYIHPLYFIIDLLLVTFHLSGNWSVLFGSSEGRLDMTLHPYPLGIQSLPLPARCTSSLFIYLWVYLCFNLVLVCSIMLSLYHHISCSISHDLSSSSQTSMYLLFQYIFVLLRFLHTEDGNRTHTMFEDDILQFLDDIWNKSDILKIINKPGGICVENIDVFGRCWQLISITIGNWLLLQHVWQYLLDFPGQHPTIWKLGMHWRPDTYAPVL